MKAEQQTVAYWENWIVSAIAKETEQSPDNIDTTAPITSFALDSIITVTLAVDLEKASGKEVDPTVFWEFPDIKTLAAWMASR